MTMPMQSLSEDNTYVDSDCTIIEHTCDVCGSATCNDLPVYHCDPTTYTAIEGSTFDLPGGDLNSPQFALCNGSNIGWAQFT